MNNGMVGPAPGPPRRSAVAVVKCDSYDPQDVVSAVRRGAGLVGGFHSFAKAGETILIKPNALVGVNPQRCVTTHPSVFRAVAVCLKETGCALTYGDSPALYDGWGRCEPALRNAGFSAVAEEVGATCADFFSGRSLTGSDANVRRQIVIANGVLHASGLVSLPKLKTHGLTRITGAIKNQYGCVPGIYKGRYHALAPNVYEFCRLLVDITALVKPRLYVMDAITAMEGNGPMNGTPRQVGAILVSADPSPSTPWRAGSSILIRGAFRFLRPARKQGLAYGRKDASTSSAIPSSRLRSATSASCAGLRCRCPITESRVSSAMPWCPGRPFPHEVAPVAEPALARAPCSPRRSNGQTRKTKNLRHSGITGAFAASAVRRYARQGQ